jgi:ParB-like chromosome segregation protein Spo0J
MNQNHRASQPHITVPPPEQATEGNSFSELLDSAAPPWCRLLREHGRDKKAKKTLLSNLRPSPEIEALWAGTTTAEEDAALEAFVTATGPVLPIIADEQGNIIDGHRCYRIYKKHNIKEVFVTILKDMTTEEKRHLAVSLNA